MIREPPQQPQQQQQTEQIDSLIQEVDNSYSLNTMTSKSLSNLKLTPNATLNVNRQNPRENRPTIVQIPKQSSRPRIFLLTRPAKPSLVRIAKPIVQTHHQKDLNLSPHYPQETTEVETKAKIQTLQQPIVPRNSLKSLSSVRIIQKKDLLQYPQEVQQYPKITAQKPQLLKHKLQDSLVINQEIIQYPHKILSPLSEHKVKVANKPASDTQNTPNNTVQAQTNILAKSPEKKEPTQVKIPLTLTSMAGIELTGADMSHTAADMSGAMPPTATVEEINVPVFIDEYLQQAAAISTTAASTIPTTVYCTENNNNNNNSSSNNIYNNNSNNYINYPIDGDGRQDNVVVEVKSSSNSKNNNIINNNNNNHCLATFDNFEFDIDLLTEYISSDGDDNDHDKALELQPNKQQQELCVQQQQQQQQIHFDISNKAAEKEKQQLQLMLEEILFNSSDSNNFNNNTNNNNNNNNNINTNDNNNNNNNPFKMANGLSDIYDGDIEDLFNVAPNSQVMDEILSPPLHEMDLSNFSPTMENAVDFNQADNECLSLMGLNMDNNDDYDNKSSSYFINSETNAIMFPTASVSAVSSQNLNTNNYPSVAALSQEILIAEPYIAPEMMHYSSYSAGSSSAPICYTYSDDDAEQFIDDNAMMDFNESKKLHAATKTMTANSMKRNNSTASNTYKHLQEKRMKLRLDIKPTRDIDASSQDLDTPAIINSILQNDDELNTCIMHPAENSTDIYNSLINSPHDSSVKSEIDVVDYYNDDIASPYTPYSVNSTSQQTNFTGMLSTEPSSPASSIATTNATSTTTRRGRGRPAKIHSDMPDLSQVQSEAERKKALERYKNNEASRKSRLKNKERDMATEQEERELRVRNQELELELQRLKRIERKLRQALKRQHFRACSL